MRFKGLFSASALLLALAGASMLGGCAASRTTGWEESADKLTLTVEEQNRLMAEGLRLWKDRANTESLKKALENFEKVARANPSHYESQALLTRGYYFLADGHILDDDRMEEKKKLWETGSTWGERALATNPEFRKLVKDEQKPVEEALHALTKHQVDALYWAAVNLGKWAKNSSIPTALKYKTRIKKMIERVEQLDPKFFYGAPDRYWAVYYATLPALFGGSMEKSESHFKQSIKTAPNYLGTHVLYAENYYVKKGDKAAYRRELELVLKTPAETLADIVPEQLKEKEKAKLMLARIDEIFE